MDAETFQFVDIERAELHIVTDVLVLDRVGFRQFVVDRLLLPVDDAEAFVEFAQPLVVVGVLRLELLMVRFCRSVKTRIPVSSRIVPVTTASRR